MREWLGGPCDLWPDNAAAARADTVLPAGCPLLLHGVVSQPGTAVIAQGAGPAAAAVAAVDRHAETLVVALTGLLAAALRGVQLALGPILCRIGTELKQQRSQQQQPAAASGS